MDGLIVRQPFADQIINGEKRFEYRDYRPPKNKMNQLLYLLSEGKAIGLVRIIDVQTREDNYAWKISVDTKFENRGLYDHSGQIIWVKKVIFK